MHAARPGRRPRDRARGRPRGRSRRGRGRRSTGISSPSRRRARPVPAGRRPLRARQARTKRSICSSGSPRTTRSSPSRTTTSPSSTRRAASTTGRARRSRARSAPTRSTPSRTRTSVTSTPASPQAYDKSARPRRRQPERAGEARARARATGRDPQDVRPPIRAQARRARALDFTLPLTQRSRTCESSCLLSPPSPARPPQLAADPQVELKTNRGDDRARALSREGAQDRRQLPAVREGRPLQRHDLSPRHRRLHGPGRRLHAECARSRRAPPVQNEAGVAGKPG